MELKVHGGADLLLPEHGLEVQTPALGGGQDHRGKARLLVVLQIGGGGLQAGAVGGELLGEHVQQGLGPQGVGVGGEGVQEDHGVVGEPGHQLLKGADEPGDLPRHQTGFQQGLHVLLHAPEVVPGPLRHPGALGKADHRVLGQVVRRRGQLGVDEGQIAVHGGEGEALGEPLPVLGEGGKEGGVVPLEPFTWEMRPSMASVRPA